ncbi:MAG: phospholipase D-like domain-containing protein, partial [Bdellovibrionota bacterium]
MRNVSFTILMSYLASSVAAQAQVGNVKFDLMHTVPECSQKLSASSPQNGNVGAKMPASWCRGTDREAVALKSGMEPKVVEMVNAAKDPSRAYIAIAYFSFSNRAVFTALCERAKAGVKIDGFFDTDYQGDPTNMPGQLGSVYDPSTKKGCLKPGAKNVTVRFLGRKDFDNDVWRLHHNKFLLVDTGNPGDDVFVNFSSCNLSSNGLSLHFDHWAMTQSPKSSNLVKQHYCVVDALKVAKPNQANADEDKPIEYRLALDTCLRNKTGWSPSQAWVETSIRNEGIAPLFSPDPKDFILATLLAQIEKVKKGGHIFGAMQHFKHWDIANALKKAVSRGVRVTLLMDDDIILGEGEVPRVREFYDKYLKAEVTGMDIRFMVTNSGKVSGDYPQ